MLEIATYQLKAAALEAGYWHDLQEHSQQWTATLKQNLAGTAFTAGLYDTVCFICNPPSDSGTEQTNPTPTTAVP